MKSKTMPNALLDNARGSRKRDVQYDVSLIVPVLNEYQHLKPLVDSLASGDSNVETEIVFVDAGSTDGTGDVLRRLANERGNIKVVPNKRRFANFAFNEGFAHTTGKYIGFLGAHAIYPGGYIRIAFEHLERDECDVVGGPLVHVGRTDTGRAIAACMSSRFGVGGTEFRTSREKAFVDSVAFGIYRRAMIEDIGLMDEDLIRNQDDEFHYRARSCGYRILMLPELQSQYFVRESLRSVFIQYFRYGSYKPLVLRKVASGTRPRHLVPALFVAYLASVWLALLWPVWLLPLVAYLLLDLWFSLSGDESLRIKSVKTFVFPCLHVAYGLGFIVGCLLPRRFWHEGSR